LNVSGFRIWMLLLRKVLSRELLELSLLICGHSLLCGLLLHGFDTLLLSLTNLGL